MADLQGFSGLEATDKVLGTNAPKVSSHAPLGGRSKFSTEAAYLANSCRDLLQQDLSMWERGSLIFLCLQKSSFKDDLLSFPGFTSQRLSTISVVDFRLNITMHQHF